MSTGWSPYKQWYPYFTTHVLYMFEDQCQAAMNTPHTVDSWCQIGAKCIFDNIDSYTQTELAGAGVMLGLAPATLAVLGPSDQGLAFLSLERPVLSLLIASSTATLCVGYPFSRNSPLQPLSDALETVWSVESLLPAKLMDKPVFISTMQYLIAAAATANTVQMSYDVTRKTIVSWSCPNWAWVLCWSFVPLFLHVVGMIVFRYTIQCEPRQELHLPQGMGEEVAHKPHSRVSRLGAWLVDRELRPCSHRVLPHYRVKYSLISQLAWWIPRTGSYLQYLMGIAIFSSLLFVPISDAFPIIVRYAVSAVAARCLLGLELQSLKRLNRPSHARELSSPRFESKFTGFDANARSMTVNAEVVKQA